MLGFEQLVGDRRDRARIGRHRRRRGGGAGGRQRHRARQRLLLQRRVVAHVDRALRLGGHDRIGAREAFRHALDRGRLVIPFDVVADRVALHQRGMRPVDVRPALGFVHRAGGADDEDRHAVDIGVVDRHAGVQQPDQIVQDHRHRLAGGLGVAVRDLHGDLLVLAQHHRRLVAAVIDQRIVQAAEARARIERDVREAVALDQIDDDVRLPAAIVLALVSFALVRLLAADELRRLVGDRLGGLIDLGHQLLDLLAGHRRDLELRARRRRRGIRDPSWSRRTPCAAPRRGPWAGRAAPRNGRPITWRAKISLKICFCSSVLAKSMTSGTSGRSGCLLSDSCTRMVMVLSSIQRLWVATTLDHDQPQRPFTSPRSIASVMSLPPG